MCAFEPRIPCGVCRAGTKQGYWSLPLAVEVLSSVGSRSRAASSREFTRPFFLLGRAARRRDFRSWPSHYGRHHILRWFKAERIVPNTPINPTLSSLASFARLMGNVMLHKEAKR